MEFAKMRCLILIVYLVLSSVSVSSEVISVNQNVKFLASAPPTVWPSRPLSIEGSKVLVFNEQQSIPSDRALNGVTEGDMVDSHYVIFDPDLSRQPGQQLYTVFSPPAVIEFDGMIVAVINLDKDLDTTDKWYGIGLDYPSTLELRGTAGQETDDRYSFSENRLTIYNLFVRDSATEPGTDHLRVITKPY